MKIENQARIFFSIFVSLTLSSIRSKRLILNFVEFHSDKRFAAIKVFSSDFQQQHEQFVYVCHYDEITKKRKIHEPTKKHCT